MADLWQDATAYAHYMGEGPYDDPPAPDEDEDPDDADEDDEADGWIEEAGDD